MKLKDTHPLIVWAQFGGMNVYRNTTLCSLFWRVVLAAPLKFAAYVVVGSLIGGVVIATPLFGLAVWIGLGEFNFNFFIVHVVAIGFLAFVCLLALIELLWTRLNSSSDKPRIIVEAYKGWKNNYCPVIEVEHDPGPGIA